MLTNFLMDNKPLVPVVLFLVAAACVGIGYFAVRAHRRGTRILVALVVLSSLLVVALTLVPAGRRMDEVMCTLQFAAPTLGRVELLANVALFFPLVYFATLATRRPLLTLTAGAALSAAIEAAQAVVPAIGRACDTNDWAMNMTGAVAAVLAATVTTRLATRGTTTRAALTHKTANRSE